MKITLISCPTWATWAPSYALGLLTAALKRAGHSPVVYDLNIDMYNAIAEDGKKLWSDENSGLWEQRDSFNDIARQMQNILESMADKVAATGSKLVCFTVNSGSRYMSLHMAHLLKKRTPDSFMLFGGPDCFRAEYGLNYMNEPGVDAICTGEGDVALPEFIAALEEGDRIGREPIKGFVTREKATSELMDGGDPDVIMDLDGLPFADYGWADFNKYTLHDRFVMMLSRGCINRCSFCSEGMNFKKYRYRTAENIIEEIKHQLRHFSPGKSVFVNFNDSLINGKIEEFEKMCGLMVQEDLKIRWGGMAWIRPEMTLEMFKKMREAGCMEIMWGLEAGNDNVLKLMKKRFDVELAERIIKDCANVGIDQYTNLIIGFPGETESDFIQTAIFALKNRQYFKLIGLPFMTLRKNSPVYMFSDKYGIEDRNEALKWKSVNGANTFELRELRRALLSEIVEDKLFHQGKYKQDTSEGESHSIKCAFQHTKLGWLKRMFRRPPVDTTA